MEFEVLFIGVSPEHFDFVTAHLNGARHKSIATGAEFERFLESHQLAPGTCVLVSTSLEGLSHFEVAQALASSFSGVHLAFMTADKALFQVADLKKNGFTESFYWPMDKSPLADWLERIAAKSPGASQRTYKAVKLLDVQPNMELPFEVHAFLPMNKKYVLLTGSGSLSQKKFEKLHERNMNSVYVETKNIDRFYEFAAEQLIAMGEGAGGGGSMTHTERSEQFQNTLRGLYRAILDTTNVTGNFEAGRDLMDQSKKIVESYVIKKTGLDLKDRFQALLGQGGDFYSHAQVVSTAACLLSMATGIGKPEDLAIAGMFHDIGVSCEMDIADPFNTEALNEEQKKAYFQHTRLSLNLLKEKRITVTPEIAEIIEKHHERFDAKGFPGGIAAHRIPEAAHLLAYSDALEYLSRPRPGRATLSPREIHEHIVGHLGLNPAVTEKVRSFVVGR